MAASFLNNARMLIAVTAAAIGGLGVYFGTQLHELIAIGAALAVFVVVHFIIPRAREDSEVHLAPGVSKADLRAVQRQGKEQMQQLDNAIRRMPKSDPASRILRNIEDIFQDIYANLNEDPGDIPRARAFLDFHSSDAISIIEGYSKLVSNRLPDDKRMQQIEMARTRFVSIEQAFRAQYNAMLENDVSALEQAGRNLETSLRIEHGLEAVVARDQQS